MRKYGSLDLSLLLLLLSSCDRPSTTSSPLPKLSIHEAAERGDLETVREWIGLGALLDEHDSRRLAPVHRAANAGHVDVVRLLGESGAALHDRDGTLAGTPLHFAAGLSFRSLALARGDTTSRIAVADYLLAQGVKIDEPSMDALTPLFWAVMARDLGMIRYLSDRGAAVRDDYLQMSALHACAHGDVAVSQDVEEIVEFLLSRGCLIDERDGDGRTALLTAVESGDQDLVQELARRGSDTNLPNDIGNTPLVLATLRGDVEMVRLLIAAGADASVRGYEGKTPLELGESLGKNEIVELLRRNE